MCGCYKISHPIDRAEGPTHLKYRVLKAAVSPVVDPSVLARDAALERVVAELNAAPTLTD